MQTTVVISTAGPGLYELTADIGRFVRERTPGQGQWRGIYLFEHRAGRHARRVVVHISD